MQLLTAFAIVNASIGISPQTLWNVICTTTGNYQCMA